MMIKRIHYITGIFMLLMSCEAITEYYIGFPQQPELSEDADTAQFNLFGVLRPDSYGEFNRSFIYVQRIWPALAFGNFSIFPDAEVEVREIFGQDSFSSIDFPLRPPDSLFFDSLYRPVERFSPLPGTTYELQCRHPDLPTAIGRTIFPPAPEIVEGSIWLEGNSFGFTLRADTLIEMVDIYLSGPGYSILAGRLVPEKQSDTEVSLTADFSPAGSKLSVFGYDINLAIYIGNSNTALNFNKYREGFTTLESGYGVFGSLNFAEVRLEQKE